MKNKPFFRVSIIIVVCAAIFAISSYLVKITNSLIPEFLADSWFAKNFFLKFYMIVLSIVSWFAITKGNLKQLGFTKAVNICWRSVLVKTAIFSVLAMILFIVINSICFIITQKEPIAFPSNSLINQILFVWIWSSIAEEIFTRGLLQSYLEPLKKITIKTRKISLSLPVITSALFFSSMHLPLLRLGFSSFVVVGIFMNTLTLGLLAGYYREKSGSLLPAIVAHIGFNIIGSLPLIIKTIVQP